MSPRLTSLSWVLSNEHIEVTEVRRGSKKLLKQAGDDVYTIKLICLSCDCFLRGLIFFIICIFLVSNKIHSGINWIKDTGDIYRA